MVASASLAVFVFVNLSPLDGGYMVAHGGRLFDLVGAVSAGTKKDWTYAANLGEICLEVPSIGTVARARSMQVIIGVMPHITTAPTSIQVRQPQCPSKAVAGY